jgi:hypothetical protein
MQEPRRTGWVPTESLTIGYTKKSLKTGKQNRGFLFGDIVACVMYSFKSASSPSDLLDL